MLQTTASCKLAFAGGGSVSTNFYPTMKDACLAYLHLVKQNNSGNAVGSFTMTIDGAVILFNENEVLGQAIRNFGSSCALASTTARVNSSIAATNSQDAEYFCKRFCQLTKTTNGINSSPPCEFRVFTLDGSIPDKTVTISY